MEYNMFYTRDILRGSNWLKIIHSLSRILMKNIFNDVNKCIA